MEDERNHIETRNIPREIGVYGAAIGFFSTIGGVVANEIDLNVISNCLYSLGGLGYLTFLGTFMVSTRAHENERGENENLESKTKQ